MCEKARSIRRRAAAAPSAAAVPFVPPSARRFSFLAGAVAVRRRRLIRLK